MNEEIDCKIAMEYFVGRTFEISRILFWSEQPLRSVRGESLLKTLMIRDC